MGTPRHHHAVALGYVATEHVTRLIADVRLDDDALHRGIPAGRVGDLDEIAHAVAFHALSSYVTGAVLPVDGGRTTFGAAGDASSPTPLDPTAPERTHA